MNLKPYIDLTDTMTALQERGFTRTFSLENGQIKCKQTQKLYHSSDTQIVEYHRFKSDAQHPVNTIIFAINCKDGEQGYLVSSENNMASIKLLEFMDKVKIQPRDETTAYTKSKS